MASLPLALTLEPLLPTRSPGGQRRVFRFGYQLRLPNGPLVEPGDPLLSVFGAASVWLDVESDCDDAIQAAGFDPGVRLRAVGEGLDEDGDPIVAVWDADELHRAGALPPDAAARVAAALDHSLCVEVVSLEESRTALDDRRVGLHVFVFSPAMVCVEAPRTHRVERPARRVRRRVVLLADGRGEVRWWDPAGESGPAEITQLPVSRQLQTELEGLGKKCEMLSRRTEETTGWASRMALGRDREEFTELALDLWKRVRAELRRDFAVGFLGPGMERPVWSPTEMCPDEEEYDMPF